MISLRQVLAHGYKSALGRLLALGLSVNLFDYPPGLWPPSTPARHYIDEFLTIYQNHVRGRCVEFYPALYREKFASNADLSSYDVWNVTPTHGATVYGDLQNAHNVPDERFDTIICTHVLCSLERPWLAVKEMHRLLTPGGAVLCTNPAVLQKYAPDPSDCWRFTRDSMAMLFSDFRRTEIHSFGNAATVSGSPFYLMTYHFPRRVLNMHDEDCPSVVAAAAWK